MSQNVDTGFKFFTAGVAIAQYLRVKLSAGKLAISTATDDDLGVIEEAAFADLDVRAVRLATAQGTIRMVASAAISAGARVFQAAGGKIASTVTGRYVGIALEAAAANNDVIEVLRRTDDVDGAIIGVAAGYKVARGQATTGSASDTVVTGLTTVVSAVGNLEDVPVIGCDRAQANIGDQAGTPAAGSILIKTFKPTSTADTTPIAATTFAKKVNWIAIGT